MANNKDSEARERFRDFLGDHQYCNYTLDMPDWVILDGRFTVQDLQRISQIMVSCVPAADPSQPKPCPFCGQLPTVTKHHREALWSLLHRCPVMGPLKLDWQSSSEGLITTWNTRT